MDIPLAPVLTEWCAMKAPKRHVTVPEIHESLLLQVTALPLVLHTPHSAFVTIAVGLTG